MSLKRLLVVLGADVGEFTKNLTGAKGTLQSVGKEMGDMGKRMSLSVTAPLVGVGAAFVGLATKAGNVADRLLDLADITGMSTDTLQEYQYVAKQAGVSTEAVSSATEGLVRRLPTLIDGESLAADAIRGLGVEFQDLSGNMRSGEAIMDDLINSLASIEDPLERNTLGSQAFGGAWKDLAPILAMGTDGIGAARQEARELGQVMENEALQGANEFRQGVETLKAQFGALFLELGTKIAPVLNDSLLPLIQDKVIPAIALFAEKVAGLIEWFGNLDPGMQTAIITVGAVVAAIGPLLLIVGKAITVFTTLAPVISAVGAVLPALGTAIMAIISGPAAPFVILGAVIVGAIALWRKFGDDIKDVLGALVSDFRELWGRLTDLVQRGVDAVLAPFRRLQETLGSIMDGAKNALQALNPFARHSPSLVDNVKAGAQVIQHEYDTLADGVGRSLKNMRSELGRFSAEARAGAKIGLGLVGSGAMSVDSDMARALASAGPYRAGHHMTAAAMMRRYEQDSRSTERQSNSHVDHTGTITIRGINDRGQLQAVAEVVMDRLGIELNIASRRV